MPVPLDVVGKGVRRGEAAEDLVDPAEVAPQVPEERDAAAIEVRQVDPGAEDRAAGVARVVHRAAAHGGDRARAVEDRHVHRGFHAVEGGVVLGVEEAGIRGGEEHGRQVARSLQPRGAEVEAAVPCEACGELGAFGAGQQGGVAEMEAGAGVAEHVGEEDALVDLDAVLVALVESGLRRRPPPRSGRGRAPARRRARPAPPRGGSASGRRSLRRRHARRARTGSARAMRGPSTARKRPPRPRRDSASASPAACRRGGGSESRRRRSARRPPRRRRFPSGRRMPIRRRSPMEGRRRGAARADRRSSPRPPVDDALGLALRALDRAWRNGAHGRRHACQRLDEGRRAAFEVRVLVLRQRAGGVRAAARRGCRAGRGAPAVTLPGGSGARGAPRPRAPLPPATGRGWRRG